MAVPTVITDLSTTIASNVPAGSESPTSLDDYQRAHAAFIAQLYANTVAATTVIVASATSTAIGAAISENVDISGTTTITSFDSVAEGINRKGRFTGALTLTHNATSLILPGTANITTAANDRYEARSLGSGNWIVTKYLYASGNAGLGANTFTGVQTMTSPSFTTPVLGTPTSGNLANCTGLARAALPAGSILQVVQGTTSTNTSVASTTYTDTTLTATITPYFNTSKIMVVVSQNYETLRAVSAAEAGVRLLRGASAIWTMAEDTGPLPWGLQVRSSGATFVGVGGIVNINYLDSPATTSATTYKMQGAVYYTASSPTINFQVEGSIANGTSTIILMEVAG